MRDEAGCVPSAASRPARSAQLVHYACNVAARQPNGPLGVSCVPLISAALAVLVFWLDGWLHGNYPGAAGGISRGYSRNRPDFAGQLLKFGTIPGLWFQRQALKVRGYNDRQRSCELFVA